MRPRRMISACRRETLGSPRAMSTPSPRPDGGDVPGRGKLSPVSSSRSWGVHGCPPFVEPRDVLSATRPWEYTHLSRARLDTPRPRPADRDTALLTVLGRRGRPASSWSPGSSHWRSAACRVGLALLAVRFRLTLPARQAGLARRALPRFDAAVAAHLGFAPSALANAVPASLTSLSGTRAARHIGWGRVSSDKMPTPSTSPSPAPPARSATHCCSASPPASCSAPTPRCGCGCWRSRRP